MIENWLKLQKFTQQVSSELEEKLGQMTPAVSLNEFYVLHFLKQNAGRDLRVSDLSQKLGLSLNATSRMLVRFEQTCNVITRTQGQEDKRSIRINLTTEGERVLEEARRQLDLVLTNYKGILTEFGRNFND
ncbi:MarR family transcriptional regulator [Ligilactobacillus agilis]|uniref:MarR family transcriptional regulator n=1 Tax=Ligilactobacillus agilis TaxID=1601 RepID=A0A9Q9J8T6_9LACO|nr:MarR family transcriptional regulator [Ligilactobacillus agilis]UXC63248.1 MarR family transcriptional regulator [Ligilactobacillus agilis]UXC65247.1 MarR family transcriptional regulator [Ligilactobacillus agilis]